MAGKPWQEIEAAALAAGASAVRPLARAELVFDPRAALKCRFGCPRWGRYWTCPPHLGLTREDWRRSLARYERVAVIQGPDAAAVQAAAVAAEGAAMAAGLTWALAVCNCVACETCAHPQPCTRPELARPSPSALELDMGSTLAAAGFTMERGEAPPAMYALVLLD